MTGPICPAEGCDYNEDGEKTAASVRRHINAKTDDAHSDLEALRAALEQSEGTAEGGAQGASDDTDDGEQGEAVTEGAEAAENEQNEHDEMDQSEEYEQQVADATGEESTDEGTQNEGQQGNDTGTTTTVEGTGRGVLGGPLVVATGLVVLVAIALAASSDNDDDEPRQVKSTVESDTEVSNIEESESNTDDGPNVANWGTGE